MKVAFTGSRSGVTTRQRWSLETLLRDLEPELCIHGASTIEKCADWDFDALSRGYGFKVQMFPPATKSSKDMLARNVQVVDAGDVLVACPSRDEYVRSGTWSTVRYARRVGKPIYIIRPNGRLEKEGCDAA